MRALCPVCRLRHDRLLAFKEKNGSLIEHKLEIDLAEYVNIYRYGQMYFSGIG